MLAVVVKLFARARELELRFDMVRASYKPVRVQAEFRLRETN